MNRYCKAQDAHIHIAMNITLNPPCEHVNKSKVDRVRVLWLKYEPPCVWGKPICQTPDLHNEEAGSGSMWWADLSSNLMPMLSDCTVLSLGERIKGEGEDILTRGVFTELFVSAFFCGYVMCCLPTMWRAQLEAITSLAWQFSELVSCSRSPGIGEMMR